MLGALVILASAVSGPRHDAPLQPQVLHEPDATNQTKPQPVHTKLISKFDAVVVPSGGETQQGKPLPWVLARLDRALEYANESSYFLVSGRGTTHEAPPINKTNDFPIDEAKGMADYLIAKGVNTKRVYLETWSLDTIGNAVATRMMHAEPREWRKLLIITSKFHMPRTKAIFDWVFSLTPANLTSFNTNHTPYDLEYEATPDKGLTSEQVAARDTKEASALSHLKVVMKSVNDLEHLHEFVFGQHVAYAPEEDPPPANKTKDEASSSYGPAKGASKGVGKAAGKGKGDKDEDEQR